MDNHYLIEATYIGKTIGGNLGYKYGYVYDLDLTIFPKYELFEWLAIHFRIDPRPLTCMSQNVQSVEYVGRDFFLKWANLRLIEKGYDQRKYPYINQEFLDKKKETQDAEL
jgi:hypothetical protein